MTGILREREHFYWKWVFLHLRHIFTVRQCLYSKQQAGHSHCVNSRPRSSLRQILAPILFVYNPQNLNAIIQNK